jgi:hypothetical protein
MKIAITLDGEVQRNVVHFDTERGEVTVEKTDDRGRRIKTPRGDAFATEVRRGKVHAKGHA